ncbi:hypothetical protein P7C73_g6250, partial [Tremellales sp. Uapishka_1]
MSRASKLFLVGSLAVSGMTVYGVHYLQVREADSMYQGVLRDEERIRLKASTPSTPLNTPSSPVQQPASIIDPDCLTCNLSPPPQLLESQSKEARKLEREERGREYEAQRRLGEKLEQQQGVTERLV